MGVTDVGFRTIICNGPECPKSVTFQMTKEAHEKTLAAEGNEWLKTVRVVETPDGRKLAYCSDVCEAKAIGAGQHNVPEPSRIIQGVANAAQVKAAADAAAAAERATAALRAGGPVTLG